MTSPISHRSYDAPQSGPGQDQQTGASATTHAAVLDSVRDLSLEEIKLLSGSAANLEASLEDLFLAGFAALLSRVTHQDTVAIFAGDSGAAILFNLEEDCSFCETVRQSRSNHPAEVIQQRARYEFHSGAKAVPDDSSADLRLALDEEKLQLTLSSPSGSWQTPATEELLSFLLTMATAGARNPDLPVNRLPLWDESAAREFYGALNQTTVEFPGPSSVPGRFAAQAKQRSNATAVISGDRKYTYRELDERSNEFARHLIAAGAGPNRAVAVCMERSVDLLMALLAVLKSGAYYVPLLPQNPAQRLQGILEECKPAALITDSQVSKSLAGVLDLSSIPVLIADFAQLQSQSLPELPSEIDTSHLAYTIYTSGTTGKPKGVSITHGALLNLICSIWRKPGIGETDKALAVAPISFDIATMDMFLPVCTGATLIMASRQDALDPYRLNQLIDEHSVTFMQATPVTWRMLVASGWRGKKDLKMIAGGEALPRELANDLCRLGGELWNCYGPTETTIYSSVQRVVMGKGIVPVGPPIANTSLYVMDKAGFPVPAGVPGELCIGGLGVSPGYVERPDLTAERFIPDRFGSNLGGKLFRTGDLVKLIDGDRFEFFGRLDHMVKLRGFRIELGEIESVLQAHPAISDAVVALREDVSDDPRLVAYVIWAGKQVGAAELRDYAAESLPTYMLPAVIVSMDQYPLSASGKVNRSALPVPESVPSQVIADRPEAAAPADEIETRLLRIFREILRNDSIGVTDNFFRYGGYSLLTVRLFSRIDRELQARLPISLLFDAPTVRELATVIRKGTVPSVIVPIRPYGQSAPIFIIQSYLLYNVMLEIVERDRPVYGVRELGDERQLLSVEEHARKFAKEILAVRPIGPLYLAGWCAAGTLTVEIARQLREAGHDVGLVALFDAERPGFTMPQGVKFLVWRLWKKFLFHVDRVRRIPWGQKSEYIFEALERNWDGIVEWYCTTQYRFLLWLHRRFGLQLSDATLNNVYMGLTTLKDFSVQPYPGKVNLFRASDVPNISGDDSTLGWSEVAQGGVEVNFVPGDHVSMFKKPHSASLARRLQQAMQNSERAAVTN